MNFYYFLISFFGLIPSDLIQEKFRNYFIFLKISYLTLFLTIFLKILKKIFSACNKNSINKIFFSIDRSLIILILMIVFYSAVPFVFQVRGEYGKIFFAYYSFIFYISF